jgi:hypothetical protein
MSTDPILTRYLYDKPDVIYSWQCAIREGKRDEALFWTVELYESGFESDIVEHIREMLTAYDTPQYPRFAKYLVDRLAEYDTSPEPICVLASMVANFVHRGLTNETMGFRESRIYIQIRLNDLYPYYEESHADIPPHKRLLNGVLCPVRKCPASTIRGNDAACLGEWLYYAASKTPLWQSRVAAYRSFRLNHHLQTSSFENDDEHEHFYETYGLEPDEQPLYANRIRGFFLCSTR